MFNNLYSYQGLSENYHKYRPKYSDDVARYIINYAKRGFRPEDKLDLMIEVGCGTGQATNVFAPFFKKVLATDASRTQVKIAAERSYFDHVTHTVSSAEDLPFENSTADLVLSSLSAHWYDLPKFFAEAQRVLKPGGCIAVIGYTMKGVSRAGSGQPVHDASQLYANFIQTHSRGLTSLMQDDIFKYKTVFNLMPWASKQRNDNFMIEQELRSRDLEGFEKSYGIFYKYEQRKNGEVVSKVEGLAEGLRRMAGVKDDDEKKLKLIYDVFVLVARV